LCTAGATVRHRRGALGSRRLDRLMPGRLVELAGRRRPVVGLDRQRIGLGLIRLR